MKNTIDSIAETLTAAPSMKTGLKTYAQAANAWKAFSQRPAQTTPTAPKTPKDHEITININDSNPDSEIRKATREQVVERVNRVIVNSKNPDLSTSQARVSVERSADCHSYLSYRTTVDNMNE